MKVKVCKICGVNSDTAKWVTKRGKIEGLRCLACENLRSKAYNATDKVKERTAARNATESSKNSRRNNVAAYRATSHGRLATQLANKLNRDKRRVKDPLFATSDRLRSLVAGSIKRANCQKGSKTYKLLGASFPTVMKHLLSPLGLKRL